MPDATKWSIPIEVIAHSRADYFAKLDASRGFGSYDSAYAGEYAYTLMHSDELIDWAGNNMNWSDVSAYAEPVPTLLVTPDYASEWSNAGKEIVDVSV